MDEMLQAELALIDAHIEQVKQTAAQWEKAAARIDASLVELAEAEQKRQKLQDRLEQLKYIASKSRLLRFRSEQQARSARSVDLDQANNRRRPVDVAIERPRAVRANVLV